MYVVSKFHKRKRARKGDAFAFLDTFWKILERKDIDEAECTIQTVGTGTVGASDGGVTTLCCATQYAAPAHRIAHNAARYAKPDESKGFVRWRSTVFQTNSYLGKDSSFPNILVRWECHVIGSFLVTNVKGITTICCAGAGSFLFAFLLRR